MRRLDRLPPIPNEGRKFQWPDGSIRWVPKPRDPKVQHRKHNAERMMRRALRLGAR